MDITLFNFRTFWEANADEDYREDIIRMSIALMTFLKTITYLLILTHLMRMALSKKI